MNHNDYSSALLAQIRNSVRDVNTIAAAETFEFFESCIPASAVKTFSRVTLTGCGDSYCAGIAAKPVFENAEAFTGTVISSCVLNTRGRVDNSMSGVRTNAVFSAFP